jgi:3-oxoadipate CoA-transferase alpha subunit
VGERRSLDEGMFVGGVDTEGSPPAQEERR